ncbi:MAG TPA: hypothetical protein VHF05_01825 [Candidatus Paceibacterota bacterium]|jgi:hypothetical protein|nr:hypothetical protein [Candidatus Paceibacterota bacterium]
MKTIATTMKYAALVGIFALAGFATASTVNAAGELSVTCAPNYSSVVEGDGMTFTAYPSGGTELYNYSWSGDDGLGGGIQSINAVYTSTGTKDAHVVVTSGSKTGEADCSVDVIPGQTSSNNTQTNTNTNGNGSIFGTTDNGSNGNPNVTVYTNTSGQVAANYNGSQYNGGQTGQSGVYLSQVPYTGAMDNFHLALYAISFFLWSGLASYWILKKKYGKELALAAAGEKNDEDELAARIVSLRTAAAR